MTNVPDVVRIVRSVRIVLFALAALVAAASAHAQGVATGSIAGVVKDASAAVLPGVTVEASSPALIEKSRTAVTDDQGAYKIVDLRPGVYTVTFMLSGFGTVRREGIELTSNFTAPINVEMKVGALEETITVTGETPVVDTQNTVQQRIIAKEVLDALPVGKSFAAYTTLVPGAIAGNPVNQDVGGTKGENTQGFKIHGSRSTDFQQLRDGMFFGTLVAAGNFMSSTNPATVQEVAVETSGFTAEAETGGGHVNVIPRDGGNFYNGSFKADYGNNALQANNITPGLQERGALTPSKIRKLYEVGGGVGGPIKRDKLWFFASARYWTSSSYQAGNYFNKTQGTLFYTPDLSRPAFDLNFYRETGVRATWQAAQKHKITGSYTTEYNCNCYFGIFAGGLAPEATGDDLYKPNWRTQWTWSFPATTRLLFWAGMTVVDGDIIRRFTGGTGNDYSVLEQSTNYRYGSSGSGLGLTTSWGTQHFGQGNENINMQYVTGSHAFKAGLSLRQGWSTKYSAINHDISYTFVNRVPNSVTYWATPFIYQHSIDNTALFAEDQWTIKRYTLNLGLRYDAMVGTVPDQHLPAGPWVPARDFAGVKDVPNWKDINPRLGVAYDVRGNGKTAVKAALGRYVNFESAAGIVLQNNPVNQTVTSATRTWNDNGDYIPQENELGPLSNVNFGKVVANTTYADDVLHGWGVRGYSWQGLVSVQHELAPGFAVNVGYFRTWFGNFTVTDNLLVTPSDYSQYCIVAPTNGALPVSGQRVCGLYDIKPEKFGQVQNQVVRASNFGKPKDIFNGVDVTVNARMRRGIIVSGGLSTGQEMTDYCFTVDSPQAGFTGTTRDSGLYQCHTAPPWSSGTQAKLSVVYPLPYYFQVSANWQNLPPIPTAASYVAANAEVLPSLGRNLGACAGRPTCTSTVTVDLIQNNTYFTEPRNNQLDIRLTRTFRAGRASVQPAFDAFNVLNAGSVLALNTRYGPQWKNAQTVLAPRLLKFGVQVNF
jgi:carboxypeptidase family protein